MIEDFGNETETAMAEHGFDAGSRFQEHGIQFSIHARFKRNLRSREHIYTTARQLDAAA
jgi:hypothetical protein